MRLDGRTRKLRRLVGRTDLHMVRLSCWIDLKLARLDVRTLQKLVGRSLNLLRPVGRIYLKLLRLVDLLRLIGRTHLDLLRLVDLLRLIGRTHLILL